MMMVVVSVARVYDKISHFNCPQGININRKLFTSR
jgi:hypothetical protein